MPTLLAHVTFAELGPVAVVFLAGVVAGALLLALLWRAGRA